MKKFLSFFLLVVFANFAQAQISDDEAKQAYQDAEEHYEAGNYYKCYQMCNDLIVKMGKPNPRILYLDLKAIYNNLEKKNDKSDYVLKKSYKNYVKFSSYADDFFAAVDKNTYPPDKYNEIVEIQKYVNASVKEYAYEKDRKPEDALNFLNECARKFPIKDLPQYNLLKVNTVFSLDSSKLKVEIFSSLKDQFKAKENLVARERILIDLSKVWIVNTPYNYYGAFNHFFYWEFGMSGMLQVYENHGTSPSKDESAPMIISSKTYIDGKAKYDNILWFNKWHYDKNLEYSDDKFEKDIKFYGFAKLSSGFYLYEFFDQILSEEFRDGNYRKRILDAFEFLIDYYGGGTPTENKQENKNKF